MLLKNSRYQQARPFEPRTQAGVFRGVRARAVTTPEGMVEHTVVEDDRLDHLARHYYNDDRLWWRIVDANPQLLCADQLLGREYRGQVILIPLVKD